jgi:hypothetical protein
MFICEWCYMNDESDSYREIEHVHVNVAWWKWYYRDGHKQMFLCECYMNIMMKVIVEMMKVKSLKWFCGDRNKQMLMWM